MNNSGFCGDSKDFNPEFEHMLEKMFVNGADIGKRKMRSYKRNKLHKSKMMSKLNRTSDYTGLDYSNYYPIYMEGGTYKNPRKNPYPKRYWTGNKWFKNYANRKVRRSKQDICGKGNDYRKVFDYQWSID